LLPCTLITRVSANGPPPRTYLPVSLHNLPENAVYADLLIPMSRQDEKYVWANYGALKGQLTDQSEIVRYDNDGYVSYTFHYRYAYSRIEIQNNEVRFFLGDASHMRDISAMGDMKLAILDAEGTILKISEKFSLEPKSFLAVSLGSVSYDVAANAVSLNTKTESVVIVVYCIISLCGLIMTVLIEIAVAWFFHFRVKTVCWVNVVSQLIMRAAALLLYGIILPNYLICVLILEVIVYVREYRVYRYFLWEHTRKKQIAFVLTANTLSLLYGLLVNDRLWLF
jgi:hypothetical protein